MAPLALISGGLTEDELWSGFSRFVPRLSWRDRALLKELPATRSTAIAKALAQAGADAQLVLGAHGDPPRRVILEPEAWRNQKKPTDRSREFRRLGPVASLADTLDPASLRSTSASALVEYALAFLNAEEARGTDALLTPAHLAGVLGEAGRDGELALAETSTTLVRQQGLDRRGCRPKPLLVGIAIYAGEVTDLASAVALARSYAALDCDGYWVQFAKLSEAAPVERIHSCCGFLFALQDLSGRPAFAVDIKNLVWPVLAGGLFGACIGIGEREAWAGLEIVSNVRRKLQPSVVHPRLLRSFVATGSAARKTFQEYPCEYGVHEPAVAPMRKAEIRRHALRVRLAMERGATSAQAPAVIEQWLTAAEWAASELQLEQPQSEAYRAPLAAAAEWRTAAAE